MRGRALEKCSSLGRRTSWRNGIIPPSLLRNVRFDLNLACLLKIDNIFYRQLITNSEEADFERKINSLVSTSIFSQTSKIFVTPLISALDKRILRFGEVLVRQGQPVRKLYFIGEGSLKLVYMDRSKRNVEHLNIVEKPVNFQTRGERRYQQKKNYSIHKTFYYAME